jgi:glutamyl-tRNA synthetase
LRRFQLTPRVKVTLEGRDTTEAVVEDKPLHKKNPEIGTRKLVYANEFIMEQEDVASFGDNEEVS